MHLRSLRRIYLTRVEKKRGCDCLYTMPDYRPRHQSSWVHFPGTNKAGKKKSMMTLSVWFFGMCIVGLVVQPENDEESDHFRFLHTACFQGLWRFDYPKPREGGLLFPSTCLLGLSYLSLTSFTLVKPLLFLLLP